jgi:hypothetical protein
MRPFLMACTVVIVVAPNTFGQQNHPRMRPTEIGTRFTPEMARAISESYTRHVLAQRYELPDEKKEEAHDAVTRRIMELAHALDTPEQQAAIEDLFATMMTVSAERGAGIWDYAPQIGKDIGPMLPNIRDLINGVAKDVRPMLPFKQQLKLGGDLAMVNTGFDAFEQTLKRWADGDVQPGENPFREQERQVELDEEGRSKEFRAAEKAAQAVLDKMGINKWADYVEQARQFYEMDDAQTATADSILREYTKLAEAVTNDEAWRDRMYQNRIWNTMSRRMPGGRYQNPLRTLLDRQHKDLLDPLMVLENQMKARIDGIPTESQRRAAEERLLGKLAEFGLNVTESEAATQ